ncbi:AfsR/SARP family transcriptional regulator [Actinophytocola sp.]|uniref:AfsR/SARP family transcriptional regulator n=1 Tax=Actinophytocola sp. TaxID=1872138 RepID=UPI00389AB87E
MLVPGEGSIVSVVLTVTTFGVLGPLEVLADGRPVALGGPQQRGLLAVLLLNANRVVSRERLVADLWGTDPPATARSLLHGCVAGLRRVLPAGPDGPRLVTRSPGYLLRVAPRELDVDRFEELAASVEPGHGTANRPSDPAAVAALRAALALWRGPALHDLPLDACRGAATRLDERRLVVLERRIDLDLRLGNFADLAAELVVLVREHPLRERLWAQLMLALHGAGRQADALAAYRELRAGLVEQLGIEPSVLPRQVERSVLAGGDALGTYFREVDPADEHGPAPAVDAPQAPVPAQLPAAIAAFTGRADDLRRLDALRTETDRDVAATAVAVAVVSGAAGVGKTALVVHWAQRVAAQFPDGQLYVNLRGFGPAGAALDPADALRGFLDALGMPAARLPADRDALTGLYRSVLAGKRVLVVLDNAGDVEQVRPLLPGAPGCLVVVTSRHQLTPLVAVEGAHPLVVDLLTRAEARDLLARRLGPDRVANEPDAVAAIIAGCAGLPLALAIVAAWAATHPGFRLATVAAQLRDVTGALDALDGGDPATDVRAVFSWSYRALSTGAARLFRLLGLHPGPEIGTAAAASLAGVPVRRVRVLLAELTQANLLTERVPGWYGCHDLLRAYATEQAHTGDDQPQRVLHRLLDHYLHTAHSAALLLHPHRAHPIALTAPGAGVTAAQLADLGQALAWFTTEHPALLAAIELAADTHTCQLAWTLATFLERQGHWHDLAATQHAAVDAARRLADRSAQARAHGSLAGAYVRLGRFGDAHTQLRCALDLFGRLGDPVGRAHTHLDLGWMFERQGRHAEALDHAARALDLFRATGHRDGQARALNQVGWCHAQLDDDQRALTCCHEALALHQALGDRAGAAHTWDSLGHAHHHLGDHRRATSCYRQALALFRQLGDRYNEADTLNHLGDIRYAAGDPDAACAAWQHALAILSELDHPDADQAPQRPHPVSELGVGLGSRRSTYGDD